MNFSRFFILFQNHVVLIRDATKKEKNITSLENCALNARRGWHSYQQSPFSLHFLSMNAMRLPSIATSYLESSNQSNAVIRSCYHFILRFLCVFVSQIDGVFIESVKSESVFCVLAKTVYT